MITDLMHLARRKIWTHSLLFMAKLFQAEETAFLSWKKRKLYLYPKHLNPYREQDTVPRGIVCPCFFSIRRQNNGEIKWIKKIIEETAKTAGPGRVITSMRPDLP